MKKAIALIMIASIILSVLPASAANYIPVGSYVTFGNYEQDANLYNGKEPITWVVLAVRGNTALLLSLYTLDSMPYNTSTYKVDWSTCTLNGWLNYTFLNEAFTMNEQRALCTMFNEPVFLLSTDEAQQYVSGRDAAPLTTRYAIQRGAWVNNYNKSWWWLRTTGNKENEAVGVNTKCYLENFHMRRESGGVRPAIWVYIDSLD